MAWTFNLGDISEKYAQSVMDIMSGTAGQTNDGRLRNVAPYYQFGAAIEKNRTPNSVLPAMFWRQSDGVYDFTRQLAGAGMTGSLGSWLLDYEVKIFGNNRAEVVTEFVYLMQSVFAQDPNPPPSPPVTRWLEPGQVQQNAKETLQVTWSVPILIPAVPATTVTLSAISSSIGFASASLDPTKGVLGFPVRTVVTRG